MHMHINFSGLYLESVCLNQNVVDPQLIVYKKWTHKIKSLKQAKFTGMSKSIEGVIYYSTLADFIQVANACQYGKHLRLENNSGKSISLKLVNQLSE